MLGKLNLGRTIAVALATAGAIAPASAQAQVWYSEPCVQYYRDICAANWQSMGFTSSEKCAEHHKETLCKGYVVYPDEPLSASANRED